MKVIFLDIDGVLNNLETKDRITPMVIGIEDPKVKLLLKIVSETNSEIVLISTWGIHWKAEEENVHKKYLNEKMQKFGLNIIDSIDSPNFQRSRSIKDYVCANGIKSFVIIDDQYFADYITEGLGNHLVRTNIQKGLTEDNVKQALTILMD